MGTAVAEANLRAMFAAVIARAFRSPDGEGERSSESD
jgi:hypothetical protein